MKKLVHIILMLLMLPNVGSSRRLPHFFTLQHDRLESWLESAIVQPLSKASTKDSKNPLKERTPHQPTFRPLSLLKFAPHPISRSWQLFEEGRLPKDRIPNPPISAIFRPPLLS